MFIFFILIFASWAAPAESKKYDVVVPLSISRYKKGFEVFLLPQLRVPLESSQLHIGNSVETSEDSEVDDADIGLDRKDYLLDDLRGHVDRPVGRNYKTSEMRIVNGSDVEIRKFPFQVAYGDICGGAIIGMKWILTAAHCGKRTHIISGSKYLSKGTLTKVANNYIHPMWTARNKQHPFDYDFQVVELATYLIFDRNTDLIKIGDTEDIIAGKMLNVTGWGRTREYGQYSDVLQAVQVPIVNKSICQQVRHPDYDNLTPRQFCAGYRIGSKDACQGDSGGPAIIEGRLVGIVSFGYGCAAPGAYGVYSKVTVVKDWVYATIHKLKYFG